MSTTHKNNAEWGGMCGHPLEDGKSVCGVGNCQEHYRLATHKNWEERFDENYPNLSMDGKPYGIYVKNFIRNEMDLLETKYDQLLDEQREEIVGEVEKLEAFKCYFGTPTKFVDKEQVISLIQKKK